MGRRLHFPLVKVDSTHSEDGGDEDEHDNHEEAGAGAGGAGLLSRARLTQAARGRRSVQSMSFENIFIVLKYELINSVKIMSYS